MRGIICIYHACCATPNNDNVLLALLRPVLAAGRRCRCHFVTGDAQDLSAFYWYVLSLVKKEMKKKKKNSMRMRNWTFEWLDAWPSWTSLLRCARRLSAAMIGNSVWRDVTAQYTRVHFIHIFIIPFHGKYLCNTPNVYKSFAIINRTANMVYFR